VSEAIQVALIAGVFGIGGVFAGALLTYLSAYFQHRRERQERTDAAADVERAIFHGAFAVCNYIAEKLNEWDGKRRLIGLSRLQLVQPYIARLIDRSPEDSERIMVSLIDVGLRLEGLMFAVGYALEAPTSENDDPFAEVDSAVEELSRAVELTQLLLGSELQIIDIEDFIHPDELQKLRAEASSAEPTLPRSHKV
jgi:hypothetical protein